jgi:hypothetical protein
LRIPLVVGKCLSNRRLLRYARDRVKGLKVAMLAPVAMGVVGLLAAQASARSVSSITLLSPADGLKVTLPGLFDPRRVTQKIHFAWHIDSCNGGVLGSAVVFGADGGPAQYQSEADPESPDGHVDIPLGVLGSVNATWHVNYQCLKDTNPHNSESRTLVIVRAKSKPKPACKKRTIRRTAACKKPKPPKEADVAVAVDPYLPPLQIGPQTGTASVKFFVSNRGPDTAHGVRLTAQFLGVVGLAINCEWTDPVLPCDLSNPTYVSVTVPALASGESALMAVKILFLIPAPIPGMLEVHADAEGTERDPVSVNNSIPSLFLPFVPVFPGP